MITPEELARYIAVLRENHVHSAKFGDIELHLSPLPQQRTNVEAFVEKAAAALTEAQMEDMLFAHTRGFPESEES